MKIYIKNMVSTRCRIFAEIELNKLGLHYQTMELGEVDLVEDITPAQLDLLGNALSDIGLELLTNKKDILIEKIKGIIVEMFHYLDDPSQLNFSDYLKERLQYDYTYLASLFSETTGITIEQYIIAHKVENVKTLLSYDDLNLNEISYKLNYKSTAHLSNQFKQVTGQTPSFFKALNNKRKSS